MAFFDLSYTIELQELQVYVLWFLAEVAIAATDLAEVIGSAVALYLLFNIPIWAGVLITSADVLFVILFGALPFVQVGMLLNGYKGSQPIQGNTLIL